MFHLRNPCEFLIFDGKSDQPSLANAVFERPGPLFKKLPPAPRGKFCSRNRGSSEAGSKLNSATILGRGRSVRNVLESEPCEFGEVWQ